MVSCEQKDKLMITEQKYLEAKKIVEQYEQEQLNIPVVSQRFHIVLEDGKAVLNVQKLSKRSEINEKTKLYYELGYKRNVNRMAVEDGNWIRTGKYTEVRNPIEFRDIEDRLDETWFLELNNFVFNGG